MLCVREANYQANKHLGRICYNVDMYKASVPKFMTIDRYSESRHSASINPQEELPESPECFPVTFAQHVNTGILTMELGHFLAISRSLSSPTKRLQNACR